MIINGMDFRLAVRTGRNGRTQAWTVSPDARLANTPPLPSGHVLVKVLNKNAKPTIESRKADELITTHPTAADQGQPVWLLQPWNGLRIGILRQFDVDKTLTPADNHKYVSGSTAAINKVNNVLCLVETTGTVYQVTNNNLVRIFTKRMR